MLQTETHVLLFYWWPGFLDSSKTNFPQLWVQASTSLIRPSWSNTEVSGQKKSLWREFYCPNKPNSYSFPEECKDATTVQILLINIPKLTPPISTENSWLSGMTKVRWVQHLLQQNVVTIVHVFLKQVLNSLDLICIIQTNGWLFFLNKEHMCDLDIQ